MSSNRPKTSNKRLSLRKKTNHKSSKSPRRRPIPAPLGINAASISTPPIQPVIRSKSSNSTNSTQTMIENLYKTYHDDHNINDNNDNMDDAPTPITDNLSGSSISDIFGGMTSVQEDSDDEARTKAMFAKLDDLDLNANKNNKNNKKIRKIQSHPAISSIHHNDKTDKTTIIRETSPSSSVCTDSSITHRYRSISMSSNQSNGSRSDEIPQSQSQSQSHSHCQSQSVSVVPEGNAIVRHEHGLLTYIGQDASCSNYIGQHASNSSNSPQILPRVRSAALMSRSHGGQHHIHHHSLSSLSCNKDKKKGRKKRRKLRFNRTNLGYQTMSNDDKIDNKNCDSNSYDHGHDIIINKNGDNIENKQNVINKIDTNRGIKCQMKLEWEWDCLTISNDQNLVALFSRNTMALLRITNYGEFEGKRDLKAGRKESRLKYGAVDAQFYPSSNEHKLISCTRNGTLIVLNFNFKGRGCLAVNNCPLRQRVHKVTWIKHTLSVLAAAEDGKCYLWDTRIDGKPSSSFNKTSSALSVKVSPFNDNLFASSHKNGILNIWDCRNNKSPFLSIKAHKSSINCMDWHQAIPNVMASCGYRDITIKIWNLTDDDIAQQNYSNYCNKMANHRYYNYEDDYRLSYNSNDNDIVASYPSSYPINSTSKLSPNCSMYPSGHVSQIGWRPCSDPKSLSANQIACSYVGSEGVVNIWDIKSSYVPVASLSSHESETKFGFMLKDKPFDSNNDDDIYNEPKTYLITCSKDKSVKLIDCGYADIPRSHLSNCAIDIAPFGNTCFVSVPRQKLHPFDQETYRHDTISTSDDDEQYVDVDDEEEEEQDDNDYDNISKNSIEYEDDNFFLNVPQIKHRTQRSYSGNNMSFSRNKKGLIPISYASDSEMANKQKQKSSTTTTTITAATATKVSTSSSSTSPPSRGSVSGIIGRILFKDKTKQNQEQSEFERVKKKEKEKECKDQDINAMAGGFKQSKIIQLTDIFNHVDAFSEFETKLSCCPLNEIPDSISPCDSSQIFRYLAKHYKLSGKSIPWICQQNEKVAQYIGYIELKQLWNLLGVLLKNVLSSHNNKLPKINNNNNNNIDNNKVSDDNTSMSSSNNNGNINHNNNHIHRQRIIDNDDDDEWWMDEDEEEEQNNNNNNNNSSQSNKDQISESYSPGQLSSNSNSNSFLSLHSIDDSHSVITTANHHRIQFQQNNNNTTPPLKILQYAFSDSDVNDNDDEHVSDDDDDDDIDDGEATMVASYIRDVLDECIERGDIQTAVTIIIMLNKYIIQYLDEDEMSDIILSYLDLLLHDGLLIEAVKVYQLTKHYKLIQQYFLCKNRLIVKCIRCKQIMRDHQCFRCHKTSRCNGCNQELLNYNNNNQQKLKHPRLLIWCQICGHGGHFDHMTNWFLNKTICSIDNCSHQCQPVLIPI